MTRSAKVGLDALSAPAREETANQLGPILLEHGGATGVALAWELQLLATPTTEGAGA